MGIEKLPYRCSWQLRSSRSPFSHVSQKRSSQPVLLHWAEPRRRYRSHIEQSYILIPRHRFECILQDPKIYLHTTLDFLIIGFSFALSDRPFQTTRVSLIGRKRESPVQCSVVIQVPSNPGTVGRTSAQGYKSALEPPKRNC